MGTPHFNKKEIDISEQEHKELAQAITDGSQKDTLGEMCYQLIRIRMAAASSAESLHTIKMLLILIVVIQLISWIASFFGFMVGLGTSVF